MNQENEWLRERLKSLAEELNECRHDLNRQAVGYNIMSAIAGMGWAVVTIGSVLGYFG